MPQIIPPINGFKFVIYLDASSRTGQHQSLPAPTDEKLSDVVIWEGGNVVEFSTIDQHYSIPALLRGQLGSKRWMERLSSS
ncbi:MAG: hypothetical protein AAF152_05340 [Cyanobacteria bacterium P01_A01_bin.114]